MTIIDQAIIAEKLFTTRLIVHTPDRDDAQALSDALDDMLLAATGKPPVPVCKGTVYAETIGLAINASGAVRYFIDHPEDIMTVTDPGETKVDATSLRTFLTTPSDALDKVKQRLSDKCRLRERQHDAREKLLALSLTPGKALNHEAIELIDKLHTLLSKGEA
tara:strand:+ start:8843 stop:9331 length:489 start_codon:yes stop_codon:yes gene_type:complete